MERIHEVIANLLRKFDLQNIYLDEDKPWLGIIATTAFAVRSMYHATLQSTQGNLVFESDMILNTLFTADWEAIKLSKQK